MRRTLCLFAVAASIALPAVGHAQTSTPNPVAVEKFLAGKKHRDEGHCDLAIKELLESVKIEPSIGAHYNLGVCYEKTNKKAALANYQRAEEIAKERNDDRLREIRAQRADFLARTPHLRLALPQPLPPDIEVSVDGDVIPTQDLQGETIYFPPAEKKGYDVRVSAPGYDDQKLTVDEGVVKKNLLVTVVLTKRSDGSRVAPPPPRTETAWGPFQFLGLGLIALGAVGITYSSVQFISYLSDESTLRGKFDDAAADADAAKCPNSAPVTAPGSDCAALITTREEFRRQYYENEEKAVSDRPLLLSVGIGGILAVAGGVLLIAYGPRSEVSASEPRAGARDRLERPKLGVLPSLTPRVQGLSIVGTF